MASTININYKEINIQLSKNNLFLDELNLIKCELEKIYNDNIGQERIAQTIRELNCEIDKIEEQIEKTTFLDLFRKNIYEQLAIKSIIGKINFLISESIENTDLLNNIIKKINLHYDKIINFQNQFRPFAIAFNNLAEGQINSNNDNQDKLKYCLENLRIIGQTIEKNIQIIPIELLNGLRQLSCVILENDLIFDKETQQGKNYEQDIKTYCYLIKNKIDEYQHKLGIEIKNNNLSKKSILKQEKILNQLLIEYLEKRLEDDSLDEEDKDFDEIILRLSRQ